MLIRKVIINVKNLHIKTVIIVFLLKLCLKSKVDQPLHMTSERLIAASRCEIANSSRISSNGQRVQGVIAPSMAKAITLQKNVELLISKG